MEFNKKSVTHEDNVRRRWLPLSSVFLRKASAISTKPRDAPYVNLREIRQKRFRRIRKRQFDPSVEAWSRKEILSSRFMRFHSSTGEKERNRNLNLRVRAFTESHTLLGMIRYAIWKTRISAATLAGVFLASWEIVAPLQLKLQRKEHGSTKRISDDESFPFLSNVEFVSARIWIWSIRQR